MNRDSQGQGPCRDSGWFPVLSSVVGDRNPPPCSRKLHSLRNVLTPPLLFVPHALCHAKTPLCVDAHAITPPPGYSTIQLKQDRIAAGQWAPGIEFTPDAVAKLATLSFSDLEGLEFQTLQSIDITLDVVRVVELLSSDNGLKDVQDFAEKVMVEFVPGKLESEEPVVETKPKKSVAYHRPSTSNGATSKKIPSSVKSSVASDLPNTSIRAEDLKESLMHGSNHHHSAGSSGGLSGNAKPTEMDIEAARAQSAADVRDLLQSITASIEK
ncbi:hypothetical protein BDK51DRAFT_31121 [Blyttiomyces helicus]|uniref:Uncharacterized protein n=1 Tax=Blyttiomyces helicus TaxID=388810 RepID=A0A4P9W8E7_9FUNG|nr:hypothetical protein BDK51DRAFT_31121 [Blyttiomyces helicus]|eukprot:RKO88799.1 hypothetical protein BDK51DRAFT_31121 [Blyttiomyces helicus]